MGRGISFFPLKIFCLTVPQNFLRIVNVSEKFGYRKILRIRRGCHCSRLNLFCLTGAKNLSFEKILVSKIFMHRSGDATMICQNFFVSHDRKTIFVGESFTVALISGTEKFGEEGGVSKFYVEKFLSHSADEKFRRRIFYCCKNFGIEEVWKRGGWEEYQNFPSKIFCFTVPKISVGESFTVALISDTEKVWIGGEGYQDYPSKIFCLTVPKIFVGEPFSVSLISGMEKVWRRGGYQDFTSKIFCFTVPKNSVRESFTVALISGSEEVWIGGCEYQDFPSKIFCLTMPKNFVGEPFRVSLTSGIENFGEEGGIKTLRQNFLSHSAENFRRGILYCCINFGYRKNLEKRGGVSKFYVESFLSHSAENFRRRILYCCINFGYRKSLDKRGDVMSLITRFFHLVMRVVNLF